MRLFYKKKIVKPNAKEAAEITARLKEKYPQMYEEIQADANYLAGLPPELRKNILKKTSGKRLKKKYGG